MEWIESRQFNPPEEFIEAVGGNPNIAKVIYQRGINSIAEVESFLDSGKYTPSAPQELPGLEVAVERIRAALDKKETICIWGDFDVDGQTATTLLYAGLKRLNENIFYHIPVRAEESHGINIPVLQKILDPQQVVGADPRWPQGNWSTPDLIITCDTGISAHQALDYCRKNNVDVVVTDHHDLPPNLPIAVAIVNPKLCPQDHPLRHLPGVGVAYKVIEAIFEFYGLGKEIEQFLDLVALGIVADLAFQKDDTRYMLQKGISVCRKAARVGLETLIDLAGVVPEHLSEEHIGYIIAPRLNALGRISDANQAVEFLTTNDKGRALTMGYELEGLNARRKLLTSQVYKGALASVQRDPSLLDDRVLVLSRLDWPSGVLGIVASRLVEKFNTPTILLSESRDLLAKGSARSVEGVDISAAIAGCKDLLDGFGGHPMAAGLSLRSEVIPEFRMCINRQVDIQGVIPSAKLPIDMEVTLQALTGEFVDEIERLAPFGPGNPPVILVCRDLKITKYAGVGHENEHLIITIKDRSGKEQEVIWWQAGDRLEELPESWFDMAFTVRSSTYRGRKEIQLQWIDYKDRASPYSGANTNNEVELIDHRGVEEPLRKLQEIYTTGFEIWAEGEHKKILGEAGYVAHSHNELQPSSTLVIWTIPASINDAKHGFDIVEPERIFLFAEKPSAPEIDEFLKLLIGIIKYAIKNYDSSLDIPAISGITAQRELVVRAGFELLEAKGYFRIFIENKDQVFIRKGGMRDSTAEEAKTRELLQLIRETNRFREYYTQMHLDQLEIIFSK